MSHIIDWSKYVRAKARERVGLEISYREECGRLMCTASFPVESADEVLSRVKAQREFWQLGGDGGEADRA